MARRFVVIDDMTGEEDAETVEFSLRGKHYEIDLAAASQELLDKALFPFIEAARSGGAAPAPSRGAQRTVATGRPTPNREHAQAVRDWARGQGMEVSVRGRISTRIQEAFDEAHGTSPTIPRPENQRKLNEQANAMLRQDEPTKAVTSVPNPFAAYQQTLTEENAGPVSVEGAVTFTPPQPGKEDSGNTTPEDRPDEISITKSALAEWLAEQGYNVDGMKYTARLKLFRDAHPNIKVTYIAEGRAA